MTKLKHTAAILLALLTVTSSFLLISPAQARNGNVKTIDILYENPGGSVTSNLLSADGMSVELGTLTDDTTVPITLTSDTALTAETTFSVSSGGSQYVTPILPATLALEKDVSTPLSLLLLLDTAGLTSPVSITVDVTVTCDDTVLRGSFTFNAAEQDDTSVPFTSQSAREYMFIDSIATKYISENQLLLAILPLTNFTNLTLAPEYSLFPQNTVYTTSDGSTHALASDGYITIHPGNTEYYVLISFPTAYSAGIRIEGKIDTGPEYFRETRTPDAYSGTPTLTASADSNLIILSGMSEHVITLTESPDFTDTDFAVTAAGAANLTFTFDKLTSSGWQTSSELISVLTTAQYESENVKSSDGNVRLSAVKGQTSPGTYKLTITQKFGNIKLAQYEFPVFTDYR